MDNILGDLRCLVYLDDMYKECDSSFHCLNEALASAPVLAHPESEDPFVLDMGASSVRIGAVLSQVHQGYKRVIAYYSQA